MTNANNHPNREAIESGQHSDLHRMLSALVPNNLFYTGKLKAAEVSPNIDSLPAFFQTFPFTQKSELIEDQQAHPPYGTNLTYPLKNYTRLNLTSTTTGTPICWLDTPESWQWNLDNKARVFQAAEIGPDDRVFFPFSFGPFIAFWLAYEAAIRIGCLCFPGGGLNSITRRRTIIDHRITAFCSTPTYAIRLGEIAHEEKIDLRSGTVKAIIVGGEPGGSNPRICSQIEELWPGARIFDHHGMTETGSVSYACPAQRDVLHVIESSYIAEVIDPATAQPAAAGSIGELVLTNLGRLGSPLIRYRTGDLVKPALPGKCACGSHDLALQGGILGRLDDMAVIRGVNIYPSAVEKIVRTFDAVAEYRVEVRNNRGMDEMRLLVEPSPSCKSTTSLVDRLQKTLKATFALNIPVNIVSAGTLPRFEMKAKRWNRV
ncbi:AMP-binding protein [bacterium]|nr:AMP-binding protein [bacterium]